MVAINMEATRVLTGVPLGGEEWLQLGELGLALLLSACIGLEREIRQKNAGLRTYTLVGLGAALFMLVSKYGFGDVVATGLVNLALGIAIGSLLGEVSARATQRRVVRRSYPQSSPPPSRTADDGYR